MQIDMTLREDRCTVFFKKTFICSFDRAGRKYLLDMGLGKVFLDMTSKAQTK